MTRTYSELKNLQTFEERFDYLKLERFIGEETFGHSRYLNQDFYRSKEWKKVRDTVILRDMGCDLGISDRPITHDVHIKGRTVPIGKIYIHHMNPIGPDDVIQHTDRLMNPEYLICCSQETHNAIHYGSKKDEPVDFFAERRPNDICPWKKGKEL